MTFIDAVAIVRDLANENVLEERWASGDETLEDVRKEQVKAVDLVDNFLDLLRGHHL